MTSICMLSFDGQSWGPVPEVPTYAMVGTPSYAELPAAAGSAAPPLIVMAVYQAPGRGLRFAIFDGDQWSPTDAAVSNASSCTSPCLARFGNQVFCFYQGTDSHGTATGVLKYVVFDGTGWSIEASVPNAPGMSQSPSAVCYTDPGDPNSDLLYCVYQNKGGKGHLAGVTFDGHGVWAPLVMPTDLPGMSNSPTAVVFENELYCLYQDYGRHGGLAGSAYNAARATWYSLNNGNDIQISGISGAALSGSPAAVVWTGGQVDDATNVDDPGDDTVQSPSRSTLICLFQGGGNSGQLRCVQYDGQSWQLQTTFGVGMPAESSPSIGTYMGAVVVTFQGNLPSLSTDIPMALDGQDTYRRVPASQQSSVLQAATGGAALQSFVQAQAATTLFLSWLAEADEDVWIQVQDTTTNQLYLVAMQEGGGATDTIEMVLSCTEVDPNQPRSSSAQSPFHVRASDGRRLRADRDVDLDRLRGTIAVATSELAAPRASDGPPPYTPPATIVVNGITYKVVGSITTTLVVNQSAAWLTHLPMGIALAAQPFLLKVAWPNIIKPVLGAVSRGVLRIAGFGAEVEAAELATVGQAARAGAAESGIAFTAIEGAEGTAAVSASLATGGLALAGMAVVMGAALVVEHFVLHNSYHSLKVYNMTPYDVTWAIPLYNNGHWALAMSPALSAGSTTPNTVIPGIGSEVIGGTTQYVFRQADFGVASGSSFNGVQYVMTFALAAAGNEPSPVGSGAVLFDIPFVGNNSLYAAVSDTPTPMSSTACQGFYDQNSSTQQTTLYTAKGTLSDGVAVQLTVSYDLLSGKQVPPGQPGATAEYWYNSIVTLQLVE